MDLPEPYRARLLSMYANEPQPTANGTLHPLDGVTKVSPEQGMALYRWACQSKATLEIGMAFGFSTLFIAASGNPHTAIDPFQDSWFMGMGKTAVPTCRWINERSDAAAIDLRRAGESFDLIFIDGNHRFDDVLTDFYLCAPLCRPHGILVFDDMFLPSIQAVVRFVRLNHADFMEIPTPDTPNIVAFRKVWTDARDWQHFVPFWR
jgi:predicted O-methyltransferase YrrM